MTKYLALDQALQVTGYAIFDEKELIANGSFSISPGKPIDYRLNSFLEHLDGLYSDFQFDHLFFEDIQKQQNVETFKKLAYVQAAILIWCWRNDMRFSILAPSHWRSIIHSNYKVNFGKTRKDQKLAAQSFVEKQYGLNLTEDECDAICLGAAGIKDLAINTSAF